MKVFFAPVAFFMFLAVLGLIVGTVVLLIRSGRTGRMIVGSMIAVLVLLGLGSMLFVRTYESTSVQSSGPMPPAPTSVVAEDFNVPQPIALWQPAVDKTFEAMPPR